MIEETSGYENNKDRERRPCAVIENGTTVTTDTQSALAPLMSAEYEAGAKNIDIGKRLVCKDFLSSARGLLGKYYRKMSITVGVSLYMGLLALYKPTVEGLYVREQ